jgi:SecD/SecF fusion protein
MTRKALAAIAVVALLAGCGGGSGPPSGTPATGTHRGVLLTYRAIPLAAPLSAATMDRVVVDVRRRLDALGAQPETVKRTGATVRVTVPATTKSAVGGDAIGQPGRLAFYDWERNVIGPDGKPAPLDPTVTGGSSAGAPGAGTHNRYTAVRLAAKRQPVAAADTPPSQGQLYLVDPATKQVVAGPATTRSALAGAVPGGHAPSGARVVKVSAGTIVVRAESRGGGAQTDQSYVLADRPALTGADVTNPGVSVDDVSHQVAVTFNFTPAGARRWQAVTRAIARRGAASQGLSGAGNQHFAIVLDDEIIAVPFIDYKQNPNGINARNGSQIEGGFTRDSARRLMAILTAGSLPVRLQLLSTRPVRLP